MRRATLRGLENLNKRHQIAAACYNLSQLLRQLYGIGTPKQCRALFAWFLASMLSLLIAGCRSIGVHTRTFLSLLIDSSASFQEDDTAKIRFFNSLLGVATRTPRSTTMNTVRIALASVFLLLTARSFGEPRSEELAALNRYVRVWDDTSDPSGKVSTTCEWILDGSFLRHSWAFDVGGGAPKNIGIQLMSYDAANHTFRTWTFYANGLALQGEGVWVAPSNVFTWTVRDSANGQTTVTKIAFVGNIQEDCSSTTLGVFTPSHLFP